MLILFSLIFLLLIGGIIYLLNNRFRFLGSFGGFMAGLGLIVMIPAVFVILLLFLANLMSVNGGGADILWFAVFGIGLSQLIYVMPILFWLNHNKLHDMLKGVITGAILIALLNGSCFLFLLPALKF